MKLSNNERRNRDIHNFVRAKELERIGTQQKFRYQAILEMAQQKFYLAPDTIADIVRDYEPPFSDDPNQIDIFTGEKPNPKKEQS